mmetsp:Transcript_11688/g.31467  ORF Transcript_11688/g.31467 Transcript_11688/m.31467 type:complete len:603 (+) Transcript_11688:51-1859(+)
MAASMDSTFGATPHAGVTAESLATQARRALRCGHSTPPFSPKSARRALGAPLGIVRATALSSPRRCPPERQGALRGRCPTLRVSPRVPSSATAAVLAGPSGDEVIAVAPLEGHAHVGSLDVAPSATSVCDETATVAPVAGFAVDEAFAGEDLCVSVSSDSRTCETPRREQPTMKNARVPVTLPADAVARRKPSASDPVLGNDESALPCTTPTPNALTESALLRSQELLAQLSSLNLGDDADDGREMKQDPCAGFSSVGDATTPRAQSLTPSAVARSLTPTPASAKIRRRAQSAMQLPVALLEMLHDMLAELRECQRPALASDAAESSATASAGEPLLLGCQASIASSPRFVEDDFATQSTTADSMVQPSSLACSSGVGSQPSSPLCTRHESKKRVSQLLDDLLEALDASKAEPRHSTVDDDMKLCEKLRQALSSTSAASQRSAGPIPHRSASAFPRTSAPLSPLISTRVIDCASPKLPPQQRIQAFVTQSVRLPAPVALARGAPAVHGGKLTCQVSPSACPLAACPSPYPPACAAFVLACPSYGQVRKPLVASSAVSPPTPSTMVSTSVSVATSATLSTLVSVSTSVAVTTHACQSPRISLR